MEVYWGFKQSVPLASQGLPVAFHTGGESEALKQFLPVSPCDRVPSYAVGSEKCEALALMIQTLLGKNAIVEMKPGETGFF